MNTTQPDKLKQVLSETAKMKRRLDCAIEALNEMRTFIRVHGLDRKAVEAGGWKFPKRVDEVLAGTTHGSGRA